jgi:hypothetical protein
LSKGIEDRNKEADYDEVKVFHLAKFYDDLIIVLVRKQLQIIGEENPEL